MNRKSKKSTPNITVLVALDSAPEAASVAAEISSSPDITVVGTAHTVPELEQMLAEHPEITILITDLYLQHLETVPLFAHLLSSRPDLDIVVYSQRTQESGVIHAIQEGATAYLLKGDDNDLAACLRLVASGGSPVSPMVARCVLDILRERTMIDEETRPSPAERDDPVTLSAREKDILQLLSKGMSFAEIGGILNISTHTVTAHVKKLYRKLQVHSRGEAVYEATVLGLLR